MALHPPLREGFALAGGHLCGGAEVSMAEGERPAIEKPEEAIGLGGVGSSPVVDPPFVEVMSNGPTMSAFSSREGDLELGDDVFIWPHPTESGKALFTVDDVAE